MFDNIKLHLLNFRIFDPHLVQILIALHGDLEGLLVHDELPHDHIDDGAGGVGGQARKGFQIFKDF